MRAFSFEFIVHLLLVVGILGAIIYAAQTYLKIEETLKGLLIFAVVVLGLGWIAHELGVF